MRGDPVKFHCERAAAELDLARHARHAAAVRAHLELSALHVQQLAQLVEATPASSAFG